MELSLDVPDEKMRELSIPSIGAREIAARLELAMLFEVSAYPKPGNVHRTRDYQNTKYEHFLAAAVSCRSGFEVAAKKGFRIAWNELRPESAHVGSIIRDAALSAIHSQRGGNTSLGTVTLLVPLAVAAGMTSTRRGLSLDRLRLNLKRILESTTAADAVAFYDAVASSRAGGMGRTSQLDLRDPSSREQILRRKIRLIDVFQLAAGWDSICLEWTTAYSITFDFGYPYFKKELSKTGDINGATVDTYLKILSERPDTLIARKAGTRKARWTSNRAKRALALGGSKTITGRKQIERLDDELRTDGNILNPGTTADLTAAVVALATLSGYRP